ncbi:MAG: competence/damage-inducible protein A [Oscillospiraceae bacterium]|nr:competence/damage-inducible protein A [Oscillospiraceae bacterium]
MTGEILCVGTELLLGDIINTNAAFLARELAALGIGVYHQTVVGDNGGRLKEAVALALSRCDLLVMTGGLGPTYDDITKETAAEALGQKLVWNQEAYDRMAAYFDCTGRVMSENNRKQATAPEGAVVFQNENGTAPGIAMESSGKIVVLLPGPPSEMEPMFYGQVRPYLEGKTGQTFFSRTVHLFGIGESAAEEKLRDLMEASLNPTVAPYAKTGEVLLRVTAAAPDKSQAQALLTPMIREIRQRLGQYVYGVDVGTLQKAAVLALVERGLTVSTAESCTGGGVAKRITEVPGSSAALKAGICTYTNEMKTALLGVDTNTLEVHGAVSAQTALEMAQGARRRTGAQIGVSVTGVAGPQPSEGKPVGLVYVGISSPWWEDVKELHLARGSGNERERVRHLAENHALYAVLQAALKVKKPPDAP